MIASQEALSLGCKYWISQSCPIYLHNYLTKSVENGGTIDSASPAYWTLSASTSYSNYAYSINANGRLNSPYQITSGTPGLRAVVQIKK